MEKFKELLFYFVTLCSAFITFGLLIIEYRKDKQESKSKSHALLVAIFASLLLILSFGNTISDHIEANYQEDKAITYRHLYDSLLSLNLNTAKAGLDSTRKVIRTSDSILIKSDSIIVRQYKFFQFEDSVQKRLNKQIINSRDLLGNITKEISDYQSGGGDTPKIFQLAQPINDSLCFLTFYIINYSKKYAMRDVTIRMKDPVVLDSLKQMYSQRDVLHFSNLYLVDFPIGILYKADEMATANLFYYKVIPNKKRFVYLIAIFWNNRSIVYEIEIEAFQGILTRNSCKISHVIF